jgi:L-lysine exporter family protein LysE/ArgO
MSFAAAISPATASAFAAGLLLSLSLIVAIGPQNTFILRQAAHRRHVATIVAICAASDVVLIGLGVAGAGVALAGRRWLLDGVRIAGAALLVAYAGLAGRRALRPTTVATQAGALESRAGVIAACLAFTWLNPAVYLDTVVLLGSVANSRPGQQWWFGGGAALASALWFIALGGAAGLLGPWLRRPRAARLLDAFVAVVMAETALRVLIG